MALAILIACYYGFYFGAMAIFVIYLPLIFLELSFSPFEIGILMSVTPLVRFISPFVLKNIKINSNLFLKSTVGTLACILVAPFFVHSFYLLCLYFVVFSVFWVVGLPFVDAIAMEKIGKEQYGKVRLFGSIGFALCALLIARFNIAPLLLWEIYTCLYFMAFIFSIYIVKSLNSNITQDIPSGSISIKSHYKFWLSAFLFQVSFGTFYTFYSVYYLDVGYSKEEISYLWTFGVACEILMFWLQAPLLKRYSPSKLFFIATAFAIPRWLIVWLYPQNRFLAYFAQSMHAFNFALYITAMFVILSQKYVNTRLAKMYFYGIAYGFGGFVGSVIGGKIYGTNLFAFCAACVVVATLLLCDFKLLFKHNILQIASK